MGTHSTLLLGKNNMPVDTPLVNANPIYGVLSPVSHHGVKANPGAMRIPDLNDKVICEIWDGLFRGEVIFPLVRRYLLERFPRAKFISHAEFGSFLGNREKEAIATLHGKLRSYGADAVIIGIAA